MDLFGAALMLQALSQAPVSETSTSMCELLPLIALESPHAGYVFTLIEIV